MKHFIASAVGMSAMALSNLASAAIPVAASTALTDLQTDGTGMIDLIWPVVAAVTVGFVLISLFKRGAGKV